MCDFWDATCQMKQAATQVAGDVADSMIGQIAHMIGDAQNTVITSTVTWWLDLPPVDVAGAPAARTVQQWMLPFAVLVAVGGMLWQCLLMVINRKGEPLVTVVKGLFATALWGAVSLTGTQLLLDACQAYTEWVLTRSLGCSPGLGQDSGCKTDALSERMLLMLVPTGLSVGPILIVVVGLLVLVASVTQAMLLLFRNGAIIILAGLLQLAAAGSFTAATGNWLRRVLGWLLALTFYEPFAATCYAVAFMLIGDRDNTDIATWFTGAGMLGLSLVALPAMMRFFNWTVGTVQSSGNSAGMLAATGAAGLHAIASRRGTTGVSVTDYARDMDRRYPPPDGGGASPGAGTAAERPAPPAYTGPPPADRAAPPAAAGRATSGGTTTGGTTAAGTAGPGTPAGATGAATAASAAGWGTSAGTATGGAAATGPAAPVVAGVVVGVKAATTAARVTADTGTRGTEGR